MLAERGDAKSQFDLGQAYEAGTGIQQNDDLAAKWYRAAATQDYAPAENRLGVMYSLGRGVNRDKAEALRWYRKAAKHRLPEGCFNVAISYYNGDGVTEEINLAYAWMLAAKDAGDLQAQEAVKRMADEMHGRIYFSEFKLADLYEQGVEIPQDLSRAADLYREIGSNDHDFGVGDAQYNLCQLYTTGKGVPLNYAEARSWCKKSTRHGVKLGYLMLGRMAELGQGEPKDPAKAAAWYQDAALVLLPDGFLASGRLRLQGTSHDDQKKAYFWFYLAQHYKVAEADSLLQQAAGNLSKKEIKKEQKRALQWIHMSDYERYHKIKTP
ncbi:MAG TPA: tetratricopeptide repeat protein [Candidatus Angelobacter sp.]|nr:tetratricopeptide repeat protein [Candidatus Angelobacter sp.]